MERRDVEGGLEDGVEGGICGGEAMERYFKACVVDSRCKQESNSIYYEALLLFHLSGDLPFVPGKSTNLQEITQLVLPCQQKEPKISWPLLMISLTLSAMRVRMP